MCGITSIREGIRHIVKQKSEQEFWNLINTLSKRTRPIFWRIQQGDNDLEVMCDVLRASATPTTQPNPLDISALAPAKFHESLEAVVDTFVEMSIVLHTCAATVDPHTGPDDCRTRLHREMIKSLVQARQPSVVLVDSLRAALGYNHQDLKVDQIHVELQTAVVEFFHELALMYNAYDLSDDV